MTTQWRQKLHLEPPQGWLNDPNGLCWFRGCYHVYFQYCPTSADGTKGKIWGHYVSRDLLNWQFSGSVLYEDTSWDQHGVYSGSAVVNEDVLHLFYTGNVLHPGGYDYIHAGREANVIHVTSGDGSIMGSKQLVLRNKDYPNCSCHVRDPNIFTLRDGVWGMVLGARDVKDQGCALVYSSEDLETWTYEYTISAGENMGYMWECPEFLTVSGQSLLSLCPQGLSRGVWNNQNLFQSGYFRTEQGQTVLMPENFREWDMGFDFYAPQTFAAPDGRRIMLAWMGMPDPAYHNPTAPLGWQHCLTIPEEITADSAGRICRNPIRELRQLRRNHMHLEDAVSTAAPLPMEIEAFPSESFTILLDQKLQLTYSAEDGEVQLEFLDAQFGAGRKIRRAKLPRCCDLRVILDTSSIQAYLDGGSCVFSSRFYPAGESLAVQVIGTTAELYDLEGMGGLADAIL